MNCAQLHNTGHGRGSADRHWEREEDGLERRAIVIRGTVQGVGFRPFVFRLASELSLGGFVRNRSGDVLVEVEGERSSVDRFLDEVASHPPRLAEVESLEWEFRDPSGQRDFRIEDSQSTPAHEVRISPDQAMCAACSAELLDPANRRFRYPFLNCTDCGPRLTIVTGAPYDRPRTTLAPFPLCSECLAEYESPGDRRFHAQPTACAACGPRLTLRDASGRAQSASEGDPMARFAELLLRGGIGALKGLGGFHLACDARCDAAVRLLRRRKGRDEKPFAVMVRNAAAAAALCELSAAERGLLESSRAPIVLLRRREEGTPIISGAVAPRRSRLGILLPYTPLHRLLIERVGGIPLVMTSGNRSDEPIAYDDGFLEQLAGIPDAILDHDRPIHVRCDDSVTQVVGGLEAPIRRSRGYAPAPLRLPTPLQEPTLAVGGHAKSTFALGVESTATLSHHLGDLDHARAFESLVHDIDHYERLFAIRPRRIVHDLHPDYASTQYARERAARQGLACVAVQHHHAHLASCLAENGLSGPAIGVTFDGTGYGDDGTAWGGEFLVGDCRAVRRAAHLEEVRMPGATQAIREPWRMALAHLRAAGEPLDLLRHRIDSDPFEVVNQLLDRESNAPRTTSMGRLFDAVASLLSLRDRVCHEGQAAAELEALAESSSEEKDYPFDLVKKGETWIVSPRPLIHSLVKTWREGIAPKNAARRFHNTVARMIVETCVRLREETSLGRVALSGGVFMNALLLAEATRRLRALGFEVLRQRRVPCNDGGLSLGQLAIAAAGGGRPSCA